MNPTEKHSGAQHILYDAELLHDATPHLFDPQRLERAGALRGSAEGRGTTHFIELEGEQYVLRHYRRGGRIATLLEDRYLRTTLARSRAWCEWHLLAKLVGLDLPVPRPAAARVVTSGPFYRADLITRRIENSQPLSQRLQSTPLNEEQWRTAGICIRRFHKQGVYHADLNAHNILLNPAGKFHLIDFDKGEIRDGNRHWREANLARLRRSLDKLSRQHHLFHFNDSCWQILMDGWRSQPA